jgi:hypothetical protein
VRLTILRLFYNAVSTVEVTYVNELTNYEKGLEVWMVMRVEDWRISRNILLRTGGTPVET